MIKKRLQNSVILLLLNVCLVMSQDIFRFEHFDSKDGLSQNSVSSILCDREGFLWAGTMNGLNRFDGYQFKIFNSGIEGNNFTNNRVIQLWQDEKGFIWIETYDHYYHFFNPETEVFSTVPDYYDPNYEKINKATSFYQYSESEILIGTNERGIFYLNHNKFRETYNRTHISDKGRYAITNNDVRFIHSDRDSSIWVGTRRGINVLTQEELRQKAYDFHHFFINYSFNSVADLDSALWFGTDEKGILIFNKNNPSYEFITQANTPALVTDQIQGLFRSPLNQILVSYKDHGMSVYNPDGKAWKTIALNGNNVDKVYFDRFQNAWITTENFGLTKLNLQTLSTKVFQLTNQSQKSITDRERHNFYEDNDSNLWIGLHGGGLAFYDRKADQFMKYINNPANPYSISSNIVHCITEDRSGQMWLGTGQYKGGLEKIVKRNPAFTHLVPTHEISQITDNVVRAIQQDSKGQIWMGTKNGKVHIYTPDLNELKGLNSSSVQFPDLLNSNVYCIYFDQNNHIWLGTKGHGVFISTTPLPDKTNNYKHLKFVRYQFNADDPASISSDNIYTIEGDAFGNIWVGTFGNGICKTRLSGYDQLTFERFNMSNSNLTNNLVRNVKVDSDSNLWVSTTFGLNLLHKDSLLNEHYNFQTFFKEVRNPNNINYNDIVEIYEDSKHQLWFGTFGGGVSVLQLPLEGTPEFKAITTQDGISNNVIFGIMEDDEDYIWLSSEYGLSRYNTIDKSIEIFNESNGLSFNNFSESTLCKLRDGRIIFGGSNGVEVINPALIESPQNMDLVRFTNFQLFNKDVVVNQPNSPLAKSISFTDHVELKYNQSSFSIEFSALDFLDPTKVQYAYLLEGFENQWNYVGNETKATFTNLPHGEYVFKLKHTNRNGQYSDQIKTLSITITPPWYETTASYVGYLLLLILILFIIRDIVVRVNKYRNDLVLEKKINDLKLRFFTNISHEIRTPLTLILGPLDDILQEGKVSEELKHQLLLMKKNTKRMIQLVNQLLDFRKIQNNKMSLSIQEVDLKLFIKNIYESFIPLAKHNGIQFKIEQPDEPLMIWADVVKLDSIIYNLVSNAFKFTPKGKMVTIVVSTDHIQRLASVKVMDEGPGIAHDDIPDIFTRFVILNRNDNRGSGIGLSLAFELAKLHGGDIYLDSKLGKGSCFCFVIPLDKAKVLSQENVKESEEQIVAEPIMPVSEYPSDILERTEIVIPDADKSTLLVVEDHRDIASYVKSRLKAEYNILLASNGKEGLEMAEAHNPDVVITDIMMPVMDGVEMTARLKENFSLCHIPVVMMTAKTDIQDKIAGYKTGAEAYITKPLNCEYLKSVVENLINQRKLVISKYRDNKTIDPKTLKVNSKDEEFLQQLLAYIEANHSEEMSVEHIAEHFCVSRTVFYNKVKGLTGMSPLEFIRQVKLKIGLALLQKGFSVAETAFKIGYSDVKYFSKQFKLMFGFPPSKAKNNAV